MKKSGLRAVVEIGFIIFLFYSNLLMGEYEHSNLAHERGLKWALLNIFTVENFVIAIVAAFAAYVIFEFLRKKL